MIGKRHAVIRESDGRYVVIDKQADHAWVYGPTTINKANQEAKRLEREHEAARQAAEAGA